MGQSEGERRRPIALRGASGTSERAAGRGRGSEADQWERASGPPGGTASSPAVTQLCHLIPGKKGAGPAARAAILLPLRLRRPRVSVPGLNSQEKLLQTF